jgi:heterodisulfide reductase subunit B
MCDHCSVWPLVPFRATRKRAVALQHVGACGAVMLLRTESRRRSNAATITTTRQAPGPACVITVCNVCMVYRKRVQCTRALAHFFQ